MVHDQMLFSNTLRSNINHLLLALAHFAIEKKSVFPLERICIYSNAHNIYLFKLLAAIKYGYKHSGNSFKESCKLVLHGLHALKNLNVSFINADCFG